MKIICIGRNYHDHIKELGNDVPTEPVIFLKPDTAILKNNEDFYYPNFSKQIQHEVELICRIGKEGKHISPEFALNYIDGIGLGIDMTARDVQNELKTKGLPWELAKSFNGSAPISNFSELNKFTDIQNIHFSAQVNGIEKQKGNTKMMIFPVKEIIAFVSKYFTLKKGDILFTGTPSGVSEIKIGDRIEATLENEKVLDFYIK